MASSRSRSRSGSGDRLHAWLNYHSSHEVQNGHAVLRRVPAFLRRSRLLCNHFACSTKGFTPPTNVGSPRSLFRLWCGAVVDVQVHTAARPATSNLHRIRCEGLPCARDFDRTMSQHMLCVARHTSWTRCFRRERVEGQLSSRSDACCEREAAAVHRQYPHELRTFASTQACEASAGVSARQSARCQAGSVSHHHHSAKLTERTQVLQIEAVP